jgi:hypothetical protein
LAIHFRGLRAQFCISIQHSVEEQGYSPARHIVYLEYCGGLISVNQVKQSTCFVTSQANLNLQRSNEIQIGLIDIIWLHIGKYRLAHQTEHQQNHLQAPVFVKHFFLHDIGF